MAEGAPDDLVVDVEIVMDRDVSQAGGLPKRAAK
jgi:hypothetical protein